MQYKIEPMRVLRGEITAPPSKSHSHRAFLLALGASSPSFLVNPLTEGDVAVTRYFCVACGATIEELRPDSPEYVPDRKSVV